MSLRNAFVLSCLAVVSGIASRALAQPAPLEVRESAVFGGPPGTLRAGPDGVTFEARDAKRSRHWTADEVRQLRIESSRRIVVETYQSLGWKGLGHSRIYEYKVTATVTPEWVALALASATRPMVTAVMPTRTGAAQFSVLVNHEGTDTRGTLALYADGLAFETPRDGFARFWRFSDLDTVLLQDRHRLLVAAYEGAREHVRPFLFTLTREPPPGFYDQLWRHVNERPRPPRVGGMSFAPQDRKDVARTGWPTRTATMPRVNARLGPRAGGAGRVAIAGPPAES